MDGNYKTPNTPPSDPPWKTSDDKLKTTIAENVTPAHVQLHCPRLNHCRRETRHGQWPKSRWTFTPLWTYGTNGNLWGNRRIPRITRSKRIRRRPTLWKLKFREELSEPIITPVDTLRIQLSQQENYRSPVAGTQLEVPQIPVTNKSDNRRYHHHHPHQTTQRETAWTITNKMWTRYLN